MTERILTRIIENLGLTLNELEQTQGVQGYRLAFEQNFYIELHEARCTTVANKMICRASTRLSKLGHSLSVQEVQVQHAMALVAEICDDIPTHASLSISNHDNCLRFCVEIDQAADDDLVFLFHRFVGFAFTFKQMYLKHTH